MSLVITSETIKPKDRIQSLKNIAMREAIVEALIEIVKESGVFGRTIARKTGDMRRYVRNAMRNLLNVKGFNMHSTGITIFTWEEITAAMKFADESKQKYLKYHIKGRGFYVKPTTLGTFPMRSSRFMPMARNSIRRKVPFKLKKYGIQNRVRFSV